MLPKLALLAWSVVGATAVLVGVSAVRHRLPPLNARTTEYFVIAGLVGLAAPNLLSFAAVSHVGAGFVAMVAGMPYFWLIWVFGFAVILPIAGILFPEDEADSELAEDDRAADVSTDPLTSLRDQYARGDLTDEEFERKLDRLIETESAENATEWRERVTEKAE